MSKLDCDVTKMKTLANDFNTLVTEVNNNINEIYDIINNLQNKSIWTGDDYLRYIDAKNKKRLGMDNFNISLTNYGSSLASVSDDIDKLIQMVKF